MSRPNLVKFPKSNDRDLFLERFLNTLIYLKKAANLAFERSRAFVLKSSVDRVAQNQNSTPPLKAVPFVSSYEIVGKLPLSDEDFEPGFEYQVADDGETVVKIETNLTEL